MAKKPLTKEEKEKKKAEKARSRKKRRGFATWGPVIGAPLLLMVYIFYETFLVLIVGLTPTLIFYLFDTTPRKTLAKTAGWMNFAGCLIVLMKLWTGHNNFLYAVSLGSDWINWMVIILCTSVGWCLYLAIPPFVESYLELSYRIRIRELYINKKELEEEWGEDVTKHSDMIGLQDAEIAYEEMVTREKTKQSRKKENEELKKHELADMPIRI